MAVEGIIGSLLKDLGSMPIMSIMNGVIGQVFTNYNRKKDYQYWEKMNAHLTGREQEQNTFNAEQAQINRDFQENMSNTQYQRAVTDMQSAGVNPALAMSNGGAGTPTGSNASGSAGDSSVSGSAGYVSAIAQMAALQSDIELKKSQRDLNLAKAEESRVNAAQIVEMTENIKEQRNLIVKNVEGLDLDNQQKSVILRYAEQNEIAKLDNLKMDKEVKEAEVSKFNAEVGKLNEETKKVVQETINLQEQVDLMLSQESLNYAQASQCAHMIDQIDQNVEMLKKDNSHYDWNHMKTLSFKDGVAVVSGADGSYAGSFTGPSAAVRSNAERRQKRQEERKRQRAENQSEAFKRNGSFR